MDAIKFIYSDSYTMSQTIDVLALEAVLLLLNQGKGCGK